MKILVLTNNDTGLYNFRKELLEKLVTEENQVSIALPGGDKIVDFMKMGCSYYQIDVDRRGMNPFKDFCLLKKYLSLFRKCKPDIVLTYTIKPNIYGGIAAELKKIRYIATITGLGTAIENGGWKRHLLFFLYKIALKNASCVFFQNQANQRCFLENEIVRGKNRLIPGSGVNLKFHSFEEYPAENENITLLFVGRIMKNKGVDELLEAVEQVKKKYPEVLFQIVGFCEEKYEEKLALLQRQGKLQYLGFQTDTRLFIKKCWALILPSYHEGLSNVLQEASAAGRPVLASKIPGCQEVFEEGKTGFGFKARDSSSLQAAIQHFIELPYLEKRKMGLEARKKMEREFDRKIVVDDYMQEIFQ